MMTTLSQYLRPWARVGEPHKESKDEAEQKKLWDWCQNEVNSYL